MVVRQLPQHAVSFGVVLRLVRSAVGRLHGADFGPAGAITKPPYLHPASGECARDPMEWTDMAEESTSKSQTWLEGTQTAKAARDAKGRQEGKGLKGKGKGEKGEEGGQQALAPPPPPPISGPNAVPAPWMAMPSAPGSSTTQPPSAAEQRLN